MKLAPFLLDQWLESKTENPGAIAYHLASSTGPHWTTRELLALEPGALERALETELVYARATGSAELREALAEMLGASADEVQVVIGASEAILILATLAATPGANVVLPAPCFPPTRGIPDAFGLDVRLYRLRREAGHAVDLDEVRSLVDERTTLLFVNTPHNPTGAVLSREELAALHDIAAERGIPFVSDEVYRPISPTGDEVPSAASLPHATVIGDLSKALCHSGLRVGYMLERDRGRMAEYLNARQTFTVSNGSLDEMLAAVAVRQRDVIFRKAEETARANMALFDELMSRHSDVFGLVRPRGGMTAFPWLRSGANARPLCEELAARGVLVVPGDCFGEPSHIRVGLGATDPAEFAAALTVMDEVLAAKAVAA
jgi:aspartate/methionine/tyrosine aminotransferase